MALVKSKRSLRKGFLYPKRHQSLWFGIIALGIFLDRLDNSDFGLFLNNLIVEFEPYLHFLRNSCSCPSPLDGADIFHATTMLRTTGEINAFS